MKPITTMDRAAVKVLGNACQAALAVVAAEYGLTLDPKRGRFDPEAGTYTPKFTFVVAPTDGTPAGEDAATFRRYAELGAIGGLRPEHLGAEFSTRQGTYQIIGLRPRKRQSVIGRDVKTKKLYCFEPRAVRTALNVADFAPLSDTHPILTLTDPPSTRTPA